MILFLSSIELAASSLVVSLKTWEMCDLGYTKVAPKVCVMQRNIGDYLTFRPQIVVDGEERVKFQKWFRLVRIFPGDKMFETLLTAGKTPALINIFTSPKSNKCEEIATQATVLS